jgi:thiosulfate dehydrogenase
VGKFILGLIIGLLAIPAGAWVYFHEGWAPAAATAQPMPFETSFAKADLHARIEREMPRSVPIAAGDPAYMAGAHVYRENCAVCHGLPGQSETAIATGEFPRPPQLWHGKGVTDDPPGETYWKVNNGIRLTGMPAFTHTLSQTQIWQVSLLLADADKIGPDVKSVLSAPLPADVPAVAQPQPPKRPAKKTG